MARRPVNEQVVVVVGASSGIGRGTAQAMAERGARVVVSARDGEALDALVETLEQRGARALAVPADVTEPEAMERVAREAVTRFGRIDTWVQAAAVSLYAPLEATEPEEFRTVLETNLLGSMHAVRAALPHLERAGGGAWIQVSSVEGLRALPYQAAYASAKHGVNAMLDALRVELRHKDSDVRVTNVLPSSMDTPLFDQARTKIGVRPKGFPPVYHPDTTARAIVRAAERPRRHVIVGGGGRMLAFAQALSPRLVDAFLQREGFARQRSDEPRSVRHADHLDAPVQGFETVVGRYPGARRERSLYTRMRSAPGGAVAAPLLLGAVLGSAAGLLWARRGRAPRTRRGPRALESEAEAAQRAIRGSWVAGTG